MSFVIDATGDLAVNNGVAYGLVQGGATEFIPDHCKWYIGASPARSFNAMRSHGIEAPVALAIIVMRAAFGEASHNAADELGPLVNNGNLLLNAAETCDNNTITALTDGRRMNPDEVNAARKAAIAQHAAQAAAAAAQAGAGGAGAAAPAALAAAPAWPFACDSISAADSRVLATPAAAQFISMCARMAYSVAACAGIGLISGAHHTRGVATQLGGAIVRLYNLSDAIRDLGLDRNATISGIFHHALHPLGYTQLAAWVQATPPAASAKFATPIAKRLPVYPGGASMVKSAMACRDTLMVAQDATLVWASIQDDVPRVTPLMAHDAAMRAWNAQRATHLAGGGTDASFAVPKPVLAPLPALTACTADARLVQCNADIIAQPLEFNQVLGGQAYGQRAAQLAAVQNYVITIFAAFDAWRQSNNLSAEDGPTSGPGMKKLKDDNIVIYGAARRAAADLLSRHPVETNSIATLGATSA